MKPATLESANAIPMLRTLGIHLTEIGETSAVMEVTVGEEHRNYFGGTHGGLVATLVDTVCFFPRPLLPAGRLVTTTHLGVTYLKATGPGDHLVARSEIVHRGRRIVSLRVTVHDQNQALVAHGDAVLTVLQEPAND